MPRSTSSSGAGMDGKWYYIEPSIGIPWEISATILPSPYSTALNKSCPTYPPPVSADCVAHTRFSPCALLETTMAIPALAAKGTSSPYHLASAGPRKKGGFRQRQDAGGPVAQQPDLVPAGAALSARAVFLLDGHGRANPSASRFSGCREDRAAAVLIGLRSPTRRRSRASPSSPSWSAVRCRWLPVVCASRRSGACFLFLVAAARSWVLLSRRWAVMGKRVKLLCW